MAGADSARCRAAAWLCRSVYGNRRRWE